METHHFTLILDSDPSSIEGRLADDLFESGCDDALLGTAEGVVHLDFDREAETLAAAISSAIRDVESVDVHVVRIEPTDLVTLSEIARRTDRSVESIRLLAEGKRGAGTFPRPARGTREPPRLWAWVEVAAWFTEHLAETIATQRPRPGTDARLQELRQELERGRRELENARVIAAFNGALALRANFPDRDSQKAVLECLAS